MELIGTKIRKIRELKNYTQEYVASKLELTIAGYGKIERNEVKVNSDRLEQIARALEVRPSQIMEFDENNVFNIQTNNGSANGTTIYQNQGYEKLIAYLEGEINRLKAELQKLCS